LAKAACSRRRIITAGLAAIAGGDLVFLLTHDLVTFLLAAGLIGFGDFFSSSQTALLSEVVPAADLIETIAAGWPVEPAEPTYRGEVAGRWRYADGGGEFGVISSVTQPFCRDCTRARISAEGVLYTCLFAADGHDLRALLRSDAPDPEITDAIETIWLRRGDRYSELRSAATSTLPRIEMFAMGG